MDCKKSDVVNVVNHPEFTGRLAIVERHASTDRFIVYLLGKPIDYHSHVLRADQMVMFEG